MSAPFFQGRCARLVYGLLIAGLTAGVTWVFLVRHSAWPLAPLAAQQPMHMNSSSSIPEVSPTLVSTSFDHRDVFQVDPTSQILLVPHHLVAGRELASLLASSPTRSHVLLLSPDHFTKGKQALSTTRQSFVWNGQRINPTPEIIDLLLNEFPEALKIQDDVFTREHGVRGLIPFIQTAWPRTNVTPVTVRLDTSNKTIEQLARVLHKELETNPNLTLIITIDFSHDLPVYLANLHDAHSIKSLEYLDIEASKLVEIDSPPLFRLLTTLTKLQNRSLQLQAHTNSLKLMKAEATPLGTSHLLMSQHPGPPLMNPTPFFTFYYDPGRKIVSSEDRAYRGYDEVQIASIPFPAVFVKEDTHTDTIWHALPIQQQATSHWTLVSDNVFETMKTERTSWEAWAAEHLSTKDLE